MDELVERGLKNKRESKYIEFKESIDLGSTRDWCEIIKDIVAIANTGGGVVVFGVNNTGEPVGADVSNVLDLDPAQIADKIYKYTGIHFSDFEVLERDKSGKTVAILRIQSVTLLSFSRNLERILLRMENRRQLSLREVSIFAMERKVKRV